MESLLTFRIILRSKKVRRIVCLFFICTFFSCTKSDDFESLSIKDFPNRVQDFSLWQMDTFFDEVQMGYILRTDDGNIIVIDGGGMATAPILQSFLLQFGGKVNTWILTHPHLDHIGAFIGIVDKGVIDVDKILHVPLKEEWVLKNEPTNYGLVSKYNRIVNASKSEKIAVGAGDFFTLGEGVKMQVLGGLNEAITVNAVNNSSMVFKIISKSKSVLFTGDLGVEGGDALLKNSNSIELQSDYVQMAHHGQNGVNKNFYATVKADYALWPTPKWVWYNKLFGKTVDIGSGNALTVRKWMEDLNIKQNYIAGLDGSIQID